MSAFRLLLLTCCVEQCLRDFMRAWSRRKVVRLAQIMVVVSALARIS
jgi:hypothetical protein